jgi:CubicO group peptidase (beta-lactamase class C family)
MLFTFHLLVGSGCSRHQDALKGRITAGAPVPEDAVEIELEQHHVPGLSIAVVHQGHTDWAKGYGVLENGKPGLVDTATLFLAASISKPVSAAMSSVNLLSGCRGSGIL